MKKAFAVVSVLSLASAFVAWLAWASNLLPDPGVGGEHWDRWERALDVAWRIILWGTVLSVVFSALAAASHPRTKKSVVFAAVITGAACAFWLLVRWSTPAIG